MKCRLFLLMAAFALAVTVSAQTMFVQKYTSRQDLSKVFVANLRAIPNTKFNLRSSDRSGGTIQAVRLIRNQELGSLFILVTQQDASSVLVEATFTRNGGWFGGGDPEGWAREYMEEMKVHLPDLTELSEEAAADPANVDPGSGLSRFERVVPFKQREVIALGISQRGMTVNSVEVIRWPAEAALRKREKNADAKGEIVVTFDQTNRAGKDYKCTYEVVLLDESDNEIGSGKRTVSVEDGEVNDTARVDITVRLADMTKAAKLRIRAVPEPDL